MKNLKKIGLISLGLLGLSSFAAQANNPYSLSNFSKYGCHKNSTVYKVLATSSDPANNKYIKLQDTSDSSYFEISRYSNFSGGSTNLPVNAGDRSFYLYLKARSTSTHTGIRPYTTIGSQLKQGNYFSTSGYHNRDCVSLSTPSNFKVSSAGSSSTFTFNTVYHADRYEIVDAANTSNILGTSTKSPTGSISTNGKSVRIRACNEGGCSSLGATINTNYWDSPIFLGSSMNYYPIQYSSSTQKSGTCSSPGSIHYYHKGPFYVSGGSRFDLYQQFCK